MEIMPLRWMKWSRNRRFHVITHVLLTYFVVPTQISYFQKFEQNYVKAFQLFIYFEDCACEKLEGSPRLMPRIPQQKMTEQAEKAGKKKKTKTKITKQSKCWEKTTFVQFSFMFSIRGQLLELGRKENKRSNHLTKLLETKIIEC